MGSHLFARPSFLLGFASIIDFGNTLSEFSYANTGEQADYLAVRSDWYAIGEDLKAAIREFREFVAADGEQRQASRR